MTVYIEDTMETHLYSKSQFSRNLHLWLTSPDRTGR